MVIDAIVNKEGQHRPELANNVFDTDKVLYLCRQSEQLVTKAEAVRGIVETRRIITIGNVSHTVLYRDATNVKATLTDDEQQNISNLEFQATWCISAAAACNIAKDLQKVDFKKYQAFMRALNKLIDQNITGDEAEPGKTIYTRKMQSLFSLLGGFFPGEELKDLSDRLEAERDMLALEEPTELVATFHKNPLDDQEVAYDIEIPNTKLSPDQRAFFQMVCNNPRDNEIGAAYDFYKKLTPWQKALTRRYAAKILEENRLRPTQMQFLPMAPNFWTRHTLVKPDGQPAEVVNVMSRCGALSPRVKATHDGIVQFQKMQYAQARTNFNLEADDKLCYTSYKQNFYGPGADDGALKNISKAHNADSTFNEKNPVFNIPMGRFAPLARIINGVHHYFFGNKFHDNDHDPLTEDAFRIVKLILRDKNEHLTIDQFINAQFNYSLGIELSSENEQLEVDIKLDLEQVYRMAAEIREIRKDYIIKDNKRVGALRSVLFHKLSELKSKLPGITFQETEVNSLKMTYQAYVSGCKSNIDRGTLVTLHAEVIALKERERRKWWYKTFAPATHTPTWLKTKSFMTNVVLSPWFPLTAVVNFFTKWMTGKTLVNHRADLARAKMERDLPGINVKLRDASATTEVKAELLKQKAALINNAIENDISIEIAVCQSGHSRIMPAHGGSLGVSGIKDSVLKAVAPHLEDQMVHLSSQDKLSSHNHHLYEKCKVKDTGKREWVSKEHMDAAANANCYKPPMAILLKQNNHSNTSSNMSSSVYAVLVLSLRNPYRVLGGRASINRKNNLHY